MGKSVVQIGRSLHTLSMGRWPYVLVEGPARTGKSRGILSILLRRAIEHDKCRIMLTRLTRTSLTQSILTTLEDEVFPSFGLPVPGGAGKAGRTEYVLPNGSVLVPVGQDNPESLYSSAWDFIYAAESIEFAEEAVMKLARGMSGNSAGWNQVILDTNPGPPRHWLNQRAQHCDDYFRIVRSAEDYKRMQGFNKSEPENGLWKRILTRIQDNPAFWDHAKWQATDRGARYLEGLSVLRGHVRARLLDGLWVAAEGSIFPEFSVAAGGHVVQPFTVPADWPTWTAWDPGRDHPTAILWVTRSPEGVLYVVDEIHRSGGNVEEFAKEIKQREASKAAEGKPYLIQGRYADPQYAFSENAMSVKSIAQQAEDYGVVMEPWPRTMNNANELQMIEAMRQLLIQKRLMVFATCQSTIDNFQSWMWQRKHDGSMKDGEDKPEDRNNDAADCLKGLVAAGIADTRPKVTITTEPVKPREGLDHVDWERERGPAGRPMAQRQKQSRGAVGMV